MNETADVFYSETALRNQFENSLSEALEKKIITHAEKSWCEKALLPLESARERGSEPLVFSQLLVAHTYHHAECVSGVFVISRTELEHSTYMLFTVLGGISKWDSWSAVVKELRALLQDRPLTLLPFLPLHLRLQVKATSGWEVSKIKVSQNLFHTLSQQYIEARILDSQRILDLLTQLPSLRTIARLKLQAVMTENAHDIDHSLQGCADVHTPRTLTDDDPEIDFLLAYYCQDKVSKHWAIEYKPARECDPSSSKTALDIESDTKRLLAETSRGLDSSFKSALTQFWSEDEGAFVSLSDAIHLIAITRFTDQLLQARYQQTLSSAEFDRFYRRAMNAPDTYTKMTTLGFSQSNTSSIEMLGWYCIFSGTEDEKVLVMTDQGLELFDNVHVLSQHLIPRLSELFPSSEPTTGPSGLEPLLSQFITRKQKSELLPEPTAHLVFEELTTDIFSVLPAKFLNKIVTDIDYLSEWRKTKYFFPASFTLRDYASIAHALSESSVDVRTLIHPQLLTLDNEGRWMSQLSTSETSSHAQEQVLTRQASSKNIIQQRLQLLSNDLDELLKSLPTLSSFAERILINKWASRGERALNPNSLLMVSPATDHASASSCSLVQALLEHATHYKRIPADDKAIHFEVVSRHQQTNQVLNARKTRVLHEILLDVSEHFRELFRAYVSTYIKPSTHAQSISVSAQMALLKNELLWAEGYYYYRFNQDLSVHDAGCVSSISAKNKLAERISYFHFVPDVHAIEFSYKAIKESPRLSNCFLITAHGGLQSDCAGHAILWTPARRFEAFASVSACQAALKARFIHDTDYLELVNCMDSHRRDFAVTHRRQLYSDHDSLFSFFRLEGDYLLELADSEVDQQLLEIDHAVDEAIELGLSSEAFQSSVLTYHERLRAGFNVPGLMFELKAIGFEKKIPAFLRNAPIRDQHEYMLILKYYRSRVENNRDYLYDIPDINVYALERLGAELQRAYPNLKLNPADIKVTVTDSIGPAWSGQIASMGNAVSIQTVSLKDYALKGFSQLSGLLTFSSSSSQELPSSFNESYIKGLVRKLDIGSHYKELLELKLAPGRPEYAERFKLFSRQLGPQTLEIAFKCKLSGTLSETGYRYVEHVLNMPDGMARPLYKNTSIVIRNVQLLTSSTATPDPVKGMYLIGPLPPTKGPLILWVAYSQEFSFKEYPDEASFIAELMTHESLQANMLTKLAPNIRAKYDHGGFSNPHMTYITQYFPKMDVLFPDGPVSLATTPIHENLFLKLYRDNFGLLLDMAMQQSISTSQADWEAFKELLSLLTQTALTLYCPSRLAIPLLAWQTSDLLQTAAHAVTQGHWGEAMSELVTSLSMLVTTRLSRAKHLLSEAYRNKNASDAHPPYDKAVTELQAVRYKFEYMQRLQHYVDHSISLSDLTYDASTGLYTNTAADAHYVVLEGHILGVKLHANRWRISIGEGAEGPAIKKSALLGWELDLGEPLLAGGPILSRPSAPPEAIEGFQQDVHEMASIRAVYPEKAAAIQSAHELAVTYLKEAKRTLNNLNDPSEIYKNHAQWLSNFLGVNRLTDAYQAQLSTAINAILDRLLKPSMNPLSSGRYIVGTSVDQLTNHRIAFVSSSNRRKYIYLENNFFDTPLDPLNTGHMPGLMETQPPFDYNRHFRASTLIHECSHQVANTYDIAYLNAPGPYPELLQQDTAPTVVNRAALKAYQENKLSKATKRSELFNDPVAEKTPVNESILAHILNTTRTQSLERARDEFLTNPTARVNIILSNADSLTLIITRLGGRIEQYIPVNQIDMPSL
ncbi:DUF6543 domain-containing protein [Pseudomonas sp. SIMBA_077]